MSSFIIIIFLASFMLVTGIVCFRSYIWWTQDRNEPPVLGASIPFLTTVLGIMRQRTNFMVQLRNKNPHVPIYTLRLPGSRIYVINSASLIPLIQRQKNVIIFDPIPAQAAANIFGVSKAGMDLINRRHTGDESYFDAFLRASHPSLAPGTGLDSISRAAAKVLEASMDKLEDMEGTIKMDLWKWVRHEIFFATTEAIYGPLNPFRCAANEDAWYDFEEGMMRLQMQVQNLSPRGRSSLQARESLVQAFCRYYEEGHHRIPDVPSMCLVKACYKYKASRGLSLEDMARTELGHVAACVSNTIPGAFWMLWHVFSDPIVLADCRAEIEQLVTVNTVRQKRSDGQVFETEVHTIDLSNLARRQTCPVITSTWYEVLRYNHVGISARVVTKDTLLDGYLLKKGSTAMIVSPVIHSDVSAWGPSAGEFQHRRFTQNNGYNDTRKRADNINPEKGPANRIFGGGSSLCPGRHFASQEILSLLALTIMRFDLHPINGQQWILPKKYIPLPTALPIPQFISSDALKFEMVARYSGRQWRVVFGNQRISKSQNVV